MRVNTRARNALAFALLAAAFAFTAYYTLALQKLEFHSDYTDTLYWAWASVDSHSLFSSTFNYAATLPFGGQWFMIPFVAAYGLSFTAHSLGMLFFAAAFTAALYWVFREARLSAAGSALSVAAILMLFGVNSKLRELFWGHIIYYSIGCLYALIGMALLLRLARKRSEGARSVAILFALLLVTAALCAANGVTGLIFFNLPLLAALAASGFYKRPTGAVKKKDGVVLLCALAAATAAGWLLGELLTRGVAQPYADSNTILLPLESWPQNALGFMPAFFGMINGLDSFYPLASSVRSALLSLVSYILVAVTLAAPFIAAKSKSFALRIAALFNLAEAGLLFGAFTASSANSAHWRVSPLVCSSAVTCALLIKELCGRERLRKPAKLCAIGMCAALLACSMPSYAKMAADYPAYEESEKIWDVLKQNGLKRGYADFWLAQGATVMSDGVLVAPVGMKMLTVYPSGYQCDTQWYEPLEGCGEYFYIPLGDGEVASAYMRRLADRVIEGGGYTAYVFSDFFVTPEGEISEALSPDRLAREYEALTAGLRAGNDALACGIDEINETGSAHHTDEDIVVGEGETLAAVGWCLDFQYGAERELYLRIDDSCLWVARVTRDDVDGGFGLAPSTERRTGFGGFINTGSFTKGPHDVALVCIDRENNAYYESNVLARLVIE